MGVASVEGYGPITRDNAADIYRDIDTYRELEPAQKALVDRYVPDDEKDKIDYELQNEKAHDEGSGKVKDAEKTDHSGQAGNVAATTGGMMLFSANLVSFVQSCAKASKLDGFAALLCGGITLVFGGVIKIMANAFDSGYSDRVSCEENAGNTNGIIDGQTEALINSMDGMNEDYANYQEGTENLTRAVNDNNSKLAELQVELADCEAAGDTAGAARISGEIKNLQKPEFKETEELEETRQGLEEYSIMAEESRGVTESCRSVSDFLKEGYVLSGFAALNAAWLTVASIMCGALCIPASFLGAANSASKLNFAGSAAGLIGVGLFSVGMGLLGDSARLMMSKTKHEFRCGEAGDDIGSNTAHLESTIDQHTALKDETAEGYATLDEDAGKDMDKGVDQANQSSTSNDGRTINYTPNVKTDAQITGKQV